MEATAGTTELRRALRALAVSAILVAIAPGQASAATWSPAVTISTETTQNDLPGFGFGSAGVGLASWNTVTCGHGHSCAGRVPSRGRAATRGLDGRFEPQRALPFGGELAVYGHRSAVLFGARTVAFGSTTGRFGRRQSFPALIAAHAVNAHGRMAILGLRVRANASSRLRLAERGKRGRFGAMRSIKGGRNASDADVAINARGDLAIAYVRAGHVLARLRRAGRPFGRAFSIGRAAANGTEVRVAVSERGAVWVLWQNRIRDADAGPFTMALAMRPAGARRFRDARVLDTRAENPIDDGTRQNFLLAVDPAGTAFATWSGSDGTWIRARLATVDASGLTATTQDLSSATYHAGVHAIATSRQPGQAVVVWLRLANEQNERPDEVSGEPEQVMAGVVEARLPFGGEEVVSAVGRVDQPAVAIEPRAGAPTVVWSLLTGPEHFTATTRRQVIRAATRSGP